MESEVVIIGAGVTGLSAGMELQDRAVILEKGRLVGGTVGSFCVDDDYWFDNVVHLLHFRNTNTEKRIKTLIGNILKPCPPIGWVETKEGTVRYPFQLNLGGLNKEAQLKCLDDFMQRDKISVHSSYKEFLLKTFGKAMCEIFFFPYNEKQWKYPLDQMTRLGQVWNISHPTIEEIHEGLLYPNQTRNSYNGNGYYPRPLKDAPLRGMGLLVKAMGEKVKNIMFNCRATHIDMGNKKVYTANDCFSYENCLSTIPLPQLMRMCDVSDTLKKEISKLKWNKVTSIGLLIKGERPENTGHWHYYTDPTIPFTKVIYMTEFDQYNAPDDGFGILLEIPGTHGSSMFTDDLHHKIIPLLFDLKILNKKNKVKGMYFWEIDPAYVIFTKETPRIVEDCKNYLKKFNITTLGRYGSWEYSSMAENIEDGFNYAKRI